MHGHKIINQNALHFITLTVVGWIDVFERQEYKELLIESLKHCQKEKGLVVCAFVIMSNHIHLIVYTKVGFSLSDIIRDFKKYTAKSLIELILNNEKESRKDWLLHLFKFFSKFNKNNRTYQFWQQDNYPIELESPTWINQKLAYIHLNPVRSGLVYNAEDYLFSSAGTYVGREGKLQIEIIELNNLIGYLG
ncbi:MAG: transposase [Saprospiraceae bacterium]